MAFDGDWSQPGMKNWGKDGLAGARSDAAEKAQEIKDAINPLPEARSALVSLGLLVGVFGVLYMVTR
jgi:hypothetical protein